MDREDNSEKETPHSVEFQRVPMRARGIMQGMKEAGFDVEGLVKGAVETVGSIVEAGKDLVKKDAKKKEQVETEGSIEAGKDLVKKDVEKKEQKEK